MEHVTLSRWEMQAVVAFLTHYVEQEERAEFGALLQKLRYTLAKTTVVEITEQFDQTERHQIYIALGEMQSGLRRLQLNSFTNRSCQKQRVLA